MSGWHHSNAKWTPKKCAVCSKEFTPTSGVNKFCSPQCRGKWKYITGSGSTEAQYASISGDWGRYLSRRLYCAGMRRDKLPRESLMQILERQDYKCALSGAPLTCLLQKGVGVATNASVDRIVAGGPYTEDNVQLVCVVLNLWRGNRTPEEFIHWCKLVAAHNTERTLPVVQGEKEQDHGQKA